MVEASASSTFTEFNVRQDKGKPHFVRLHDSVVKDLERELIGAGEQSGVLFGSIEYGESCTITIEEFQPAAKLAEWIRTWRGEAALKIVGYYRSHSSPEFTLNVADRALFERCFPTEARLLLLVKPPRAGAGKAIFFLGENGQLAIDRATVEFPFNLRALGADESLMPSPVVAAPRAGEQPRRNWKLPATAAVSLTCVLGLNALHVFDRQTPPVQTRPVAVERQAHFDKPVAVTPPPPPEPPKPQLRPVRSVKAPAIVTPKRNDLSRPARRVTAAAASIPAQQPAQTPAPEAPRESTVTPTPQVIEQQPTPRRSPPASPVQSPKSEPIVLTPPRVVRQSAPVVRENVRRSIPGELVIKVRVNVDKAGKVTSAESLSRGSPVAEALSSSAIAAVKQWQFEPSRRGEEKVPGDIVLTFTFRK